MTTLDAATDALRPILDGVDGQLKSAQEATDAALVHVGSLMAERDELARQLALAKGRPTGIDPTVGVPYVTYESLYRTGDTITDALNRLSIPAVVTFPEGQFRFSGRSAKTRSGVETEAGINLDKDMVCGIWGAGPGTLGGSSGTVFVDTAGRPGKSGSHMIRSVGASRGLVLHGFQVVGADQGADFQGIYVYAPTGPILAEDLLISGWQGSSASPPGETFGLLVYTTKGPQPVTVRRVECDGRRTLGGDIFGTVGITLGKGVGGVVEDCYVHHNRISARVVLYHTTGATIRRTRMGDDDEPANGWPFNSECSTSASIEACHFGRAQGKIHASWSSTNHADTWGGVTYPQTDGKVIFRNPTWHPEGFSGQFTIESWQTGIDGSSIDTLTTPPIVVDANGKGITYHWHHGTHQTITVNHT